MIRLTSAFILALLLPTPQAAAQSLTWTQIGAPGVFTFATSPDYANDGTTWFVPSPVNYQGERDIHVATDFGNAVQFWSSLPAGQHRIDALTISPTFAVDSTVVASSDENLVSFGRIWKSADAGLTWTETPQPAPIPHSDDLRTVVLSPDFATDQIILSSGLSQGGAVRRSSDGGISWTHISTPTGPTSWQMMEIKFAEDFATSGFAYCYKAYGSPRFFRTSDYGVTWSECSHPLSSPGLCPALDRVFGIAVAPVGPQGQRAIYFHGRGSAFDPSNFLRSTNNGDDWAYVGGGLAGLSIYDLDVADDGRVYAATNSGVYFSDDQGVSFSPLGALGLPNPVTKIELAGGPDGDLYVLAGGAPDAVYFGNVGGLQPGNLYRLRLSEFGDVFCASLPNRTGVVGGLRAFGSTLVAANDLELEAFDLPPLQFGMFIVSRDAAPAPISISSNGLLCLGGTIGRFTQPNQILSSGAAGTFSLPIDLGAIPQGTIFAAIAAGETWHFQAWHREFGGAGSNLTSGLRVTFQ